jgi:flagellar motor switch protein FliG
MSMTAEAIQETEQTNPKELSEFAAMSQVQKLARLLFMLTPENSTQILKTLDEEHLEAVSSEMLKITSINNEVQEEILREFSPLAVSASTAIPAGVDRVQQLLDKSIGPLRASDIIGRVSPLRAPVAAMQQIVEMAPSQLWNILRDEQLQTVALVASYLPDAKASQLLQFMRPDVREQFIERLATLAPTSIEVVESMAEALQRKAGSNRTRGATQTGGVRVAAQVLNALPKDVSKSILATLNERNPDLADQVSKKMFTFEELEFFDVKSLQTIMQTVETQTLVYSLKTASEGLRQKILSCLSKRAAENVMEEITFLGPLKLSEIDAARSSVIDIVKSLDSTGEIEMDEARRAARN